MIDNRPENSSQIIITTSVCFLYWFILNELPLRRLHCVKWYEVYHTCIWPLRSILCRAINDELFCCDSDRTLSKNRPNWLILSCLPTRNDISSESILLLCQCSLFVVVVLYLFHIGSIANCSDEISQFIKAPNVAGNTSKELRSNLTVRYENTDWAYKMKNRSSKYECINYYLEKCRSVGGILFWHFLKTWSSTSQ